LLTEREIVRAKLLGSAWGARRLLATSLTIWGAGLLARAIDPLGLVAATVALVVLLGFAAALGLYASLRAPSTSRALVATIGTLVALNLGIAMAAAGSPSGAPRPWLAGSAPWLAWAAPLAPRVDRASAPDPRVEAGSSREVLMTLVSLGLIVHALAATALVRAAIRDMRRSSK
jgi:hypothetical protein